METYLYEHIQMKMSAKLELIDVLHMQNVLTQLDPINANAKTALLATVTPATISISVQRYF